MTRAVSLLRALLTGESWAGELAVRVGMSTGNAVSALLKLQRQGLLTRREEWVSLPQGGSRPRFYYGLTEAGIRAAHAGAAVVHNAPRGRSQWKEWHEALLRRAKELRRQAQTWHLSAQQSKSYHRKTKRHISAAFIRAAELLEQAQREIELMEE